MKRYLYTLVIIALLTGNHAIQAQDQDSAKVVRILTKCWRVIGHEYSSVYALEEEEVTALLKKKLCLTKDSIMLYNGTLYEPKFTIKKVEASDYMKANFDCDKVKLGIHKDSIYEVTISTVTNLLHNTTTHKMTDVIAFDGDCIFVQNDGVIFKLFDNDAKKEARGAN